MAKYKFGEPKFSSKLVRKSKGAPTVPRVLIVCEGSKTEPNYLKDVCKYLGIGSAVVHVVGEECGSAPLTLVEYAKECIRKDKSFSAAYCVFDRDQHDTFDDALKEIARHNKLNAIVSYPCVEYWFYIHFSYTRAPFSSVGKNSAGDSMVAKLRSDHWSEYGKGMVNAHSHLAKHGSIDDAIDRAVKARVDVASTGEPNPSTQMDLLYLRLKSIADSLPDS